MIKRILVGLGGTPYTPFAIERGIELAQAHQAELTGVTVVDVRRLKRVGPVPLGASASARELREFRLQVAQEHVEEATSQFEAACRKAGIPHRVRQEEGNPFTMMAREARYHDLMIFGLKSLFEHEVVRDPHDTLVRLIAEGVRPILAVSPDARPVARVLVAYSGSMESAKTIKWLAQLRPWPQAQVRIVTFRDNVEDAEHLVADAAEYLRCHGYEPEAVCWPGSPKHGVLSHATEWEADVIVAGNSAKNLFLRKTFGETALNLIRNADRSLFLAQ